MKNCNYFIHETDCQTSDRERMPELLCRFETISYVGADRLRYVASVCRDVMHLGPFFEEKENFREGFPGTDERTSVSVYLRGIRILTGLMEKPCIEAVPVKKWRINDE